MLNVECSMLNDREIASFSLNIQHSTLNIPHSTFAVRPMPRRRLELTKHPSGRRPSMKPLAFRKNLPHTTSRTFRATIPVRHPRRAFQRMVFSALIVGFPASLEGRANYIKGRCFL